MPHEVATMRVRHIRVGVLALALAALAGCATHRGYKYQDKNMDFGAIRTVAVMPFANLSRDNLAAERVRDAYASMLLSTGAVYVLPYGEVVRGVAKVGIGIPTTPSAEEVTKLGTQLKADGIITGVVREYGELRSGVAMSNVCSLSVQLLETATGKVVWSGETTRGGITWLDRLFGGGGAPLNDVTEAAVDDLLNKMFK
jgi:polysaccharide biosynthesis protein PelC